VTRAGLLALGIAAACGAPPPPARAPRHPKAERTPEPVFTHDWHLRGAAACPRGTHLAEGVITRGRTLSCEKPGRVKHGPFTSFYTGGQVREEGLFVDDEKQGLWTEWHENGQKRRELTFVDDHPDGAFTEWYDNGQIKVQGAFLDGRPDGEPTRFDSKGRDMKDWAVEAPRDGDLERYTADLDGSGALVATVQTGEGVLRCELFAGDAPHTVANFVGLARGLKPFLDPATGEVAKRPFYDGLVFHRVIPDFMIQGGDPLGTGTGGPGYSFANEDSGHKHDEPGVLAMANSGRDTNGSQFYITETAQPHLDAGFTVFGQCEPLKVIEKIARKPTPPVVMTSVTIGRE
jgi:peptidyl-prolyl cis-trans isomerase A (cyclophilin A)